MQIVQELKTVKKLTPSTPHIRRWNCYKCKDRNYLVECACGKCGNVICKYNKRGTLRQFISGHNQIGKRNLACWKGGRFLENGYWLIQRRNHKRADSKGYVFEHNIALGFTGYFGQEERREVIIVA